MFSFSQQQIAQFQAFGFVVMRGLLNEAETATLTREVTAALTDAFGGIGTDTDPAGAGGIRGHYLPLSVDRTPLSQSLMADDPRLFQGSAALLGHPTVPTAPIATCFTSNAGWHTDQGPRVGGVKFLAHLQRRTGGSCQAPTTRRSRSGCAASGQGTRPCRASKAGRSPAWYWRPSRVT